MIGKILQSFSKLFHSVRINGTVVDLGADNVGDYHGLLTSNGDRFLIVDNHKKFGGKVALNDKLTIYGFLNGKGVSNSNQISSGISRAYEDDKTILILIDRVNDHSRI